MPIPSGPKPLSPAAPTGRFLFVPVSGPGGAGEYFRSLAIAGAVSERWPRADVRFVLNRHAAYAAGCPYRTVLTDDSPTRDVKPVISAIEDLRPDVVVFDSAGRVAQLRAARGVGACCIYISSRPKTRWKGFKLSRMRWLDEHWIASPAFLGLDLTWPERLKLWLMPRVQVRFLPTLFEAPTEALREAVLSRHGLVRDRYVLCCPGGAGQFAGLRSGPEVYAAAAAVIASVGSLPVVLVGAPAGLALDGVVTTGSLPNAELMALAGSARYCVINGGSLLIQCLAQRAACVCAPIAGDQAGRIAACERLGAVHASTFDADALAGHALSLAGDDAAIAGLRAAAANLKLRNGVDIATDALDALLARRLALSPPPP